MITDFLLDLLHTWSATLYGWLPAWTVTLDTTQLQSFLASYDRMDQFFPVHEVLTCVGVIGLVVGVLYGYKLLVKFIDWITNVIP